MSSGEPALPSVETGMSAPVLPVVGTVVCAVAKVFGSTPTDSVAGSAASGSVAEAVTGWTSRPTPVLSPAPRWSV